MSKKTKNSLLATALLILLSTFSYVNFIKFKPKTLIPAKEVKGSRSEKEERIKLPYPKNYKVIGRARKENGEHITYKTTQTPEEIQTFYRNVLISKDWKITSTGSAGIFTTTKYKQEKKQINITTSRQANEEQTEEEFTLVSLLIKN